MITWVLLLIPIALIVHNLVSRYKRLHQIIDVIPGPKPCPIIGDILSFHCSQEEAWSHLRKFADTYYPIYRLWAGATIPFINVRHPDDVEIILGNPKFITKSTLYHFLEPWFGKGLLTSTGAKWHKRRKMLTPAFHFSVLQQFVEIFIEVGDHLTKSLKKEGKPVVKDLLLLIKEHTLNVFCETALGTSLRSTEKTQQTYTNAVHDISSIPMYRLARPWLHSNFMFGLVPTGWRQAKLLKILHGFTRRIISERKSYHDQTGGRYLMNFDKENGNAGAENGEDLGLRKKRLAMLDLLLAAQRKHQIDDEGIREEVDTFMFEGHDTSALSICYTIMLLAEHKEIQERARAEVNAVLAENDNKMSLSALQHLPYLERCIKESLRLYPSVHLTSRKIEQTVRLSNYVVPKGTMVNVHIIDVHRDPNFWPEPEVFDPDRFLPEKIQGRHPYSYIPFSAGARNCIGQRFAMLELKAIIGAVLRNFYVEPIDYLKDVRINADITIQPSKAIYAKFIPIN